MTHSPENLTELYDLLHALSEQEITAGQVARLEELVRQDSALRRVYLVYMQWHATAERYGVPANGMSSPGPLLSEAAVADTTQPPAAGPVTVFRSPAASGQLSPVDRRAGAPLGLPGVGNDAIQNHSSWGLPTLAFGGVLVLIAAMLGGFWYTTGRLGDDSGLRDGTSAGQARRSEAPALSAVLVATLVDSADCVWTNLPFAARDNARLPSGWVRLAAGMAQIKFDCGATVLLQGPAEFALDSDRCGTLRSGRLVSKANAESGFTILTSNTEVVDLGTEFGVSADAGGSTEVHVFDGAVRVRQRGVLHGAVPERILVAGQAARCESKPFDSTVESASRLDGPMGITFGPDGNLYIASRFTDSILRYDGQTGALRGIFVTSRAGDLNSPFFLIFGPDGDLYVSSTGNHSVLRFNGQTGQFIDAFVPPRGGGIAEPTGLAFGQDGHLYVASVGKQSVFRFDGKTGKPLGKFVESRSGGLNGPTGIAFGPDGDLWVVDRNRNCLMRYGGQTGEFAAQWDFDGKLKFPFGVAFSPAGKLFVASKANHQIVRIDPSATAASGATGQFDGPAWPHALTFGPDQRLYVSSDSANAVMRYDQETGEFIDTFVVGWQELQVDRENFVRKMPDRLTLSSGLSRVGEKLRPGEHCPQWIISKSPDPRFITPGPAVVTEALPGWSANSNTSSWVSVAPLREDYRVAQGEYIFFTGVEIHAQDLGKAMLVGTLWARNEIVEVRLNDQPVAAGIRKQPDGQAIEIVVDRGFTLGVNFLQIVVSNGDEGAVAFRAELELVRHRQSQEQVEPAPIAP